jgi:uncharacterized caspase-like protein
MLQAPTARRIASAAAALLVLGLAACVTLSRDAPPARVALVIGNAAYENVPALNNPVNDAQDMCAALRRQGFKTQCHLNVRDRAAFEQHVEQYLGQLGRNSVGVFFYSGHGVQAGSANFLIPTQVQLRSTSENPLRALYGLEDLFDSMRQRPARLQLVILDACRTDLFSKAARPAGAGAPVAAARSTLLRALDNTGQARTALAPIRDAPVDTVVLWATGSGEAAYDGDGRNGPLTKHLLQHIGTQGLTLEQFLKRVTAGVAQETRNVYGTRQSPFTYGSFGGDFCFVDCQPVPPPPAAL